MALDVVEEAGERRGAAGPADQPAMQPDRHHFRRSFALGVQHVETVLQIGEEVIAGVEALRVDETHVVVVEAVGDDDLRRDRAVDPVWQVVGIRIRQIEKPAGLHDQRIGVDRRTAGVPADRPFPGRLRVDADRLGDAGALLVLRHVLVFDPFQSVAGDVPVRLVHRRDDLRIAGERGRHAEYGDTDTAFREHTPQSPEAGARAVFEHGFDVGMALSGPGLRPQHIGEERLGGRIAMENIVFAALLEIHHELDGDAGAIGPARVRRIAAIAAQVARVACVGHRRGTPGQVHSRCGGSCSPTLRAAPTLCKPRASRR